MPESSPIKPPPVRNVLNVVLGDMLFPTWYPSFYPEDLVGKECQDLHVCRWCFAYSKELAPYLAHVASELLVRFLGFCPADPGF